MALSRDDVAKLADLARLELTETELERLVGQLDLILTAVDSVSQAATAEVAPTSHALALVNVMRDDVVTASLPREAVLAMAPAVEDGRFRVPRILGESA
ncbi:MAG: Asp-tRNA(Asn)/Glu-tRNA(Gln) amidotransferase subunit GatC [Propionibacteriaceae bacterium]|nr:Asp-tRNA(Asn)/Glu-tRNA(Gln) amidotransferase subunit GatC [Propionibacteriaceae bacterium]